MVAAGSGGVGNIIGTPAVIALDYRKGVLGDAEVMAEAIGLIDTGIRVGVGRVDTRTIFGRVVRRDVGDEER